MKSLAQIAGNLQPTREPTSRLYASAAYDINEVFKTLKATFTAFRVAYSSDDDMRLAKKVWTKALIENGITSHEQIAFGMRKARQQETDFAPSVGKFIAWCKPTAEDFGLELSAVVNEIVRRRGVFKGQEFKFSHPVIKLINDRIGYQIYRVNAESFTKTVKSELENWVKRLANGEQLPEPMLALEHAKSNTKPYAEQIGYEPKSFEAKALMDRINRNKRGASNDV